MSSIAQVTDFFTQLCIMVYFHSAVAFKKKRVKIILILEQKNATVFAFLELS